VLLVRWHRAPSQGMYSRETRNARSARRSGHRGPTYAPPRKEKRRPIREFAITGEKDGSPPQGAPDPQPASKEASAEDAMEAMCLDG
jgi:hypothetical protein